MTMARWQRELDGYTRELAEQKQVLAKINRGELPTIEDVSVIDFDNEHYCSLNSNCNELKTLKNSFRSSDNRISNT